VSRLVVTKEIAIIGDLNSPAVISWETKQPYQSTIEVSPGVSVRLENLVIRHSSPSVANNYAIFCLRGSRVDVVNCDVSSKTGSGLAFEGASGSLTRCSVRNCERNGLVVAGFDSFERLAEIGDTELDRNNGRDLLDEDIAFQVRLAISAVCSQFMPFPTLYVTV
jgi:hypothetical protein